MCNKFKVIFIIIDIKVGVKEELKLFYYFFFFFRIDSIL
jgi:hypothetical protein